MNIVNTFNALIISISVIFFEYFSAVVVVVVVVVVVMVGKDNVSSCVEIVAVGQE